MWYVRLGVVAEPAGETGMAATPSTVKQVTALRYEVVVVKGAGSAASFAAPMQNAHAPA
jgi:NAD(P) transhydrogenase subunit alpha